MSAAPRPTMGELLAENARLKTERRMIVSHATMGTTDGAGMSVNEIGVRVTALRNELYEDGIARGFARAKEQDAAPQLPAKP